jgi:predicted glycoside hydrolase/deacetylase ChbG (UPF0249 family)
MVFMKDSERAATIALEHGIDAGLHLNFTAPFSAAGIATRLAMHQERLSQYLLRNRLAQVMYHPELTPSFEYVVTAQREEFTRLYGRDPVRLDGHHHMHLCANVVLGELLPLGTLVRRHFSFQQGEKSFANRLYRQLVNRILARRHCLTDFFFSLAPLEPPDRLKRIVGLGQSFIVEVETHPANQAEYRYLTNGGLARYSVLVG